MIFLMISYCSLNRIPEYHPGIIAIAVKGGGVTLSGFVWPYDEKFWAENKAKGTYGVRAVADDMQVVVAPRHTDPEIARDAVQTLEKQVDVPDDAIMLTVEDAWVRLQGSVEWEFQKQIAGTAVKNLKDVEGVFNNIEVKRGSHK